MQSAASTVEQYLDELPEERKQAMKKLRTTIKKNLPKGFEEGMAYGMIGYVVPHKLYPPGYHCDPAKPLYLLSIGSQKNFIVLHHLGIYADPALLKWFMDAHAEKVPGKLDMGKGCVRFKKTDQIPYDLIAELAKKLTPEQWVEQYEKMLNKRK